MARIAYYRVSTIDQSIQAQRNEMGGGFEHEYKDEGVSGSVVARNREGFSKLLNFIRPGDSLHVYAVDRLGRDAIDVQATVRELLERGIEVHIHGLGVISRGVGELILAVLAQVADMERQRIKARCDAGREVARKTLKETGKTHKGKESLGRLMAGNPSEVKTLKAEGKTLAQIMEQTKLSKATVCRYLKQAQ